MPVYDVRGISEEMIVRQTQLRKHWICNEKENNNNIGALYHRNQQIEGVHHTELSEFTAK